MRHIIVTNRAALKSTLDRLYHGFNDPQAATDPIQAVRRFAAVEDREVVGFLAAALAFGRVLGVLQSVDRLLAVMGDRPAAFVRAFAPERDGRALRTFVHRWTRGADITALLWMLRQMLETDGSLEGFFVRGHDDSREDVGPSLDSFSARALALDIRRAYGRIPQRPGVCYFFPRPSHGSGCKRLNLFLRWMVRSDALDLGVWSRVRPAMLVIPLDTHVIRVAQCLRLTRYRSPGWPMAREITAALRALDPTDPVKYDFSLCHLGMMNACGFNRPERDAHCPLRGVCQPPAGTRGASRQPSARR
jgi:uncharacterized protein (TIGR02757 family)